MTKFFAYPPNQVEIDIYIKAFWKVFQYSRASWDIGELKSDYKSLTPKLTQVLKRIQMSKNVTGVMVMNQDGMPVIMIIIFNILILFCFMFI